MLLGFQDPKELPDHVPKDFQWPEMQELWQQQKRRGRDTANCIPKWGRRLPAQKPPPKAPPPQRQYAAGPPKAAPAQQQNAAEDVDILGLNGPPAPEPKAKPPFWSLRCRILTCLHRQRSLRLRQWQILMRLQQQCLQRRILMWLQQRCLRHGGRTRYSPWRRLQQSRQDLRGTGSGQLALLGHRRNLRRSRLLPKMWHP